MFDFDAGKLIIVGVIALIFIPPKDLPRVLRQAGQFVGKMRRMAAEFQGQFMDAMREADMAELRREAQKLSDAARISTGFDTMHALDRDISGALDRSAVPAVSPELTHHGAPSASVEPAASLAAPVAPVHEDAAKQLEASDSATGHSA
jgi:sec-independent protein translocase protein TatB